jgi:hypothetical protein
MPDRKDLAKYLRQLLTAQADVTATPEMPRQTQPTIGPRTGVRDPAPQSGVLASLARSMAPSEDTPMGMVNEMFNPLRQGAAARQMAGQAMGAADRGEAGRATALSILAAMSVPGIPGDEMDKARKAMRELSVAPEPRPYFNVPDELMGYGRAPKGFQESKYPYTANVLVRYPDGTAQVDQIRGMNPEHALERARRNWEGADVKLYQGPLENDPSRWMSSERQP